MKVWSAVFNLIAVLIIAVMLVIFNKIESVNARQFEELRLAQAVDYAVEAGFRSAISTDNIGTDYVAGGLQEVQLNPTEVMDTFYNVLCMNYDISVNEENKKKVEESVATAVLCCVDGYYLLESMEVDNDPNDVLIGREYGLRWGIKLPFIVYSENNSRIFAANLVNEKTTEFIQNSNLVYRLTFDEQVEEMNNVATDLSREKVDTAISKLITEDINYAIHARNLDSTGKKIRSFYLPSSETVTAINKVKSPSLILIFQDSTFLNGYDIDIASVGGVRVKVKSSVIGFTIAGRTGKYYCYAGQQLGESGVTITDRFDTLHEAAVAGYIPHIAWLKKPAYGKLQ